MVIERRTNGTYERKKALLRAVITFLMFIMMFLWAFPQAIHAENISIDNNFPDENFRAYVKSNFDKNKDGYLSTDEISAVTEINVNDKGISDMTGLWMFVNLTKLYCSRNNIVNLNIDNNISLEELACSNNSLANLDVSRNKELKVLYCDANVIVGLDLKDNSQLQELSCAGNCLTGLDLQNNTQLQRLTCTKNQIKTLDLTHNTELERCYCMSNLITGLDVSRNIHLKTFWCGDNPIGNIDIANNKELEDFHCGNNQLNSLDVSKNTELRELDCGENPIGKLDVSNNKKLERLDCYKDQLKSLNLNNNETLSDLSCYDNQLEMLDVSNNTELVRLSCGENPLKELDASNNPALKELNIYTYGGKLTKLNISECSQLEELDCSGHEISELDVTNNVMLRKLSCGGNRIKNLDISKNIQLEDLGCAGNRIANLDISKNTKLRRLECGGNLLTTLDLSKNLDLEHLGCYSNKLSALDVSNNKSLNYLRAELNYFKTVDITGIVGITDTDGTISEDGNTITFRVRTDDPDDDMPDDPSDNTDDERSGIPLANGLTIYDYGATTEAEVIRRINEIRTVFPGDKAGCYFTDYEDRSKICDIEEHKRTDPKKKGNKYAGICSHCSVKNIMNSMKYAKDPSKSFQLLRQKDANTCMGFVTFVYEYVFRRPFHNGDDRNEDDPRMLDSYVENKKEEVGMAHAYSYEYVTKNAVIGDILIFRYTNGGIHWAIYAGADTVNQQIILFESNGMPGWDVNAVHYGTRDESSFKTVTIRRDIEYDKGITANTHTYRNNKDFFVNCPVNIEVISGNEVVGRITENVIDEDVSVIDMYVNGDEKMFTLPDDNQYKIKLSAFDSGTMDFTVCTPGAGDEGMTKQFRDIVLTEGKLFETDVADNTKETKLFVVDSEGKKIGEVSENGTEKAIDTDSVSDDNLKQTPPVDPYLYETLTAGDNTYTIKWPKTVKFDGRKHNGVGMTADNSPYNPKESSSKICDVEVTISMNGEIIDPSSYTVKTKNNKRANLSPDGTETIQPKTPSFKIKAKGEALLGLKDQLKSKNFEFGILPLELNKEKMSFENQKTAKDGSTVFGKVLFNGPDKEGHPLPKTLKLKYKSDETKTDYVTTVSENGELLFTGKNNYFGTVTCK